MVELTRRASTGKTHRELIAAQHIVDIQDLPHGVKVTPVAGEAFFVTETYEQVRDKLAA
jgi:hypothetical protein